MWWWGKEGVGVGGRVSKQPRGSDHKSVLITRAVVAFFPSPSSQCTPSYTLGASEQRKSRRGLG
jgi:hypothetical protein